MLSLATSCFPTLRQGAGWTLITTFVKVLLLAATWTTSASRHEWQHHRVLREDHGPSIISVFVIAGKFITLVVAKVQWLGVEGTGHHFWNHVNSGLLSESEPTLPDHERLRLTMQICFSSLSSSNARIFPCARHSNGCQRAVDFDERLCRAVPEVKVPPRQEALFVPGCSYPCGNPKALIQHVSPDLIRFGAEALRNQVRLLVVVMVREPVACVASAYFRRHPESSFRATAFNLYLNLGLLDYQLQNIGRDGYMLVHYEKIVNEIDMPVVQELAAFLSIPPPKLLRAITKAAHRDKNVRTSHKFSLDDRLYVEHLYYRRTSRKFFPIFWDAFQVYKPPKFWDAMPSVDADSV